MPLRRLTPILLAFAVIAGCASQPAGYDYDDTVDFAQYGSWSWLTQPQQEASGDPRIDNPLTRQRIESAIERNLADKGFDKDENNYDFRVGYLVTVETRLSSSGVSTSFGFGRYSGGSGVGVSIGGPGTQIREYEEGTLIVDMLDADSGKLVWRGSSSGRLGQTKTPEESERMINKMVNEILANFPPPSG